MLTNKHFTIMIYSLINILLDRLFNVLQMVKNIGQWIKKSVSNFVSGLGANICDSLPWILSCPIHDTCMHNVIHIFINGTGIDFDHKIVGQI